MSPALTRLLERARALAQKPPVRALLQLLAAYAVAVLILVAMELTRVAIEGIALSDYLPDLKGRAFFTISPILALTLFFLWCLTGRLTAATLLTLTGAAALLVAHLKKMEVLEKPLVPGDFTQIREVLGVIDAVLAGDTLQVVLIGLFLCLCLGAFLFLLTRRPRWPLNPALRVAFALLFALALFAETRAPWLKHVFAAQKLTTVGWNYDLNLRRHGLLLSLLLDARQVIYRPADYSKEAALHALDPDTSPPPGTSRLGTRARCGGNGPRYRHPADYPDIILFLGESFWDPTALDVRFSRDPIPNFHRFQNEDGFVFGTMLSPSFAGSTGNVEFEILTGIPLAVLPQHATPYSNYLIRPIEALPTILKRKGYQTRAFHNYFNYYYQRFAVYPRLGFDEFISLEDLTPQSLDGQLPTQETNMRAIRHISRGDYDALFDGQFPSDESLILRVLDELNKAETSYAPPQFIFAISMQSHGRYQGERFPQPDIQILDESLPETARHELENYTNALFRSDRALGHFMDQLKKRERPTLVVFFGDHLPSITADTYAAAGMDFGPLEVKKYEVPVYFWSNEKLNIDLPTQFGANYLGYQILNAARLKPGDYFQRVGQLMRHVTAFGHTRLKASDGVWFEGVDDPDLYSSAQLARDDFFMLAYDRLFGNQFSHADGGGEDDISTLGTFEIRDVPN